MSILTLEETKLWLRVDGDEEDTTIATLIAAAETYLVNATGKQFDSTNDLAKIFVLVLVADWFENRQAVGKISENTRQTVQSMLAQLTYCYPESK
ncbi:head-tail connector protein [Brevibacillus borstelensis]|uniref:head-tail connector protein n=1 Tax=Brevibacillus borstelensis TaxID=45462 RepID=UPI002E1C249E|nr:head-tail connector protein [Brevibacillus borstelensis]